MKKNMGSVDRFVRISLAALIAALFFGKVISGPVAIVLGIVAVAFIATSFISTCPAYIPFGLSTRKSKG